MRWAEVATTRAQITRLLAEHDPWKSPTGDGLGPRAPPVEHAKLRVPEQPEQPEQLQLGFEVG